LIIRAQKKIEDKEVDELLIKRYKNGDHAAFQQLYEAHAAGALRLARVITREDHLAADAVQEAFIRAFVHRQKLKPNARFDLWFQKIVVNESRRILSRNKLVFWGDKPTEIGEATEDTHAFEQYEVLYKSLEKLPEILRTAVALKYGSCLSEAEIADVLGINKNTVKSRLFQARQKLKAMIQENEEGIDHEQV